MGFIEAFSHMCIMYMTLFSSACLPPLPTSQVPFYFHVVCVCMCTHLCDPISFMRVAYMRKGEVLFIGGKTFYQWLPIKKMLPSTPPTTNCLKP